MKNDENLENLVLNQTNKIRKEMNTTTATTTKTQRRFRSFNLQKWVAENKHLMKPPVGNKLLFDGEFKVMLAAGPNSRTDYHIDPAEEWYYQLQGQMVLKVVDNGVFYDVPIKEGETFCLPAFVPHSPQRMPDSVGLVVERRRNAEEIDGMSWYCQVESCRNLLFHKDFFCNDLVKDLPPIIQQYYSDVEKRTCSKCGFVETPPPPQPTTTKTAAMNK